MKLVKEYLYEGRVKKLKIFDFDDTLVKSNSKVYVKKENGEIFPLSTQEYANYKLKPGEEFDFTEFKNVDINTEIIDKQFEFFKDAVQSNEDVVILTARAESDAVANYLKNKFNIDIPVISSGMESKANWVEKQIKNGYTDIFFMDDAIEHINNVNMLKFKYPNIRIKTELV
jgi:hypothetical protein